VLGVVGASAYWAQASKILLRERPAIDTWPTMSVDVNREITLDFKRSERIGFEEAIFCQGKAVAHLDAILSQASERNASLLLTRLSEAQLHALPPAHQHRVDYEAVSRTGYFNKVPAPLAPAQVAIVAAGTSDAHVTREVERTLTYAGFGSTLFMDVGVAALWRVMDRIEQIRRHPIVIVVAGMDAALPTLVGGLVSGCLIGVPTSNGYGVAQGGMSALNAMLASCSPGLSVMNIDNGYGAACAAMRVLRLLK
jgi:pyridinium-3,5-biscarboxylic acid mononucleotide synthase